MAIEDYDTGLQLDPGLADVVNARGELRRRRGNLPKALADFGAAIKRIVRAATCEDFSDIPNDLGVPDHRQLGGTDPGTYRAAEAAGRIAQDIPVDHAAGFAPVIQPTLDTGTSALAVAALAWLGR